MTVRFACSGLALGCTQAHSSQRVWNRVSHMTASAAHRCLACSARRQLSIEEADDLGVHHLVHRIAIEAFRVLRGLPGHESQYPRETRDEREMPGPFDENVFRR